MIRAVSLALLCAASFAAVYFAMAPDEPDGAAPATIGAGEPAAEAAEASAASVGSDATLLALRTGMAAQPSPPAVEAVRDVTPANMTAAPPVTGPLARVEPPAPEAPAPAREARLERLFNPVVVSAGAIKVGEREIRLAGISATEPDAKCGEDAQAWPCGRVARSALRSFIRGRAIECEVPVGADAIPDPARCLVGGEDIAEWLVAQGWAERSGSAYDDAERTASDGKLGLFSESRPDAQPEEVATRR